MSYHSPDVDFGPDVAAEVFRQVLAYHGAALHAAVTFQGPGILKPGVPAVGLRGDIIAVVMKDDPALGPVLELVLRVRGGLSPPV